MRYCKKCVMPDTRPGITFNEEGICSACQSYEHRKSIDWDARFYEVAKEEFLRQSRVFSCEETRAERAVYAASAFIEAMKTYQSKEKNN